MSRPPKRDERTKPTRPGRATPALDDTQALCTGSRTRLRRVTSLDETAFLSLAERSRALHAGWVRPPLDAASFREYVARTGETFVPLAVCRREDGELAGIVNVSQIFMGPFRSAYLGFYAFAPSAGQGLMSEGLALAVRYAFDQLGLHRLEANIQPANEASIRLVRRGGFEREGFSKDYLFIDGAWRDHERWAIRQEILER